MDVGRGSVNGNGNESSADQQGRLRNGGKSTKDGPRARTFGALGCSVEAYHPW